MRMATMLGIISISFASIPDSRANPGWTYDGDADGQEEWGNLSEAYRNCALGKNQSPVVISYTKSEKLPPLNIHYGLSHAIASWRNHMLDIELKSGNTLSVDGTVYHLKSIQFHMPSEHTVREKFYLMEIHFVHENAKGGQLVMGIFAEAKESNAALAAALSHIPSKSGEIISLNLNPSDFLPESRGYFSYNGSMTYPPCTENVEWKILKQPVSVSREQLELFGKLLGRNARLEQPVYMRTISETID